MSFLTISFGLRVLKQTLRPQTRSTFPKLFLRACSSKSCLKMGTKDQLMSIIGEQCDVNIDKVTVVGTGDVGMACVFSILAQNLSSDVAMIDLNEKKMMGELLDLQHGCIFLNAKISAGPDYAITAGSKVCVITAERTSLPLEGVMELLECCLRNSYFQVDHVYQKGTKRHFYTNRGLRQKEGESRLELVQRNTDVLKTIVPNLVKHSPDTILIVVSNPCDIMTWVTWKLSGLPKNRVMGSGTSLDSARFRFFIGEKLGIAPESVHAWIIGEHGDSSVAVWSGANVAGVKLRDLNPNIGTDNDPECWKTLHKKVIEAAGDVIKLKGFTNWAIGLSAASLVKSILRNSNKVHGVSTYIKGMCGIEHELFLSLPATLGRNGVTNIIDIHLAEEERCCLKFSAAKMMEIINGVKL